MELSSDSKHDICNHTRHIFNDIHEIEKQIKKLTEIHRKIKDHLYRIADSNDTVRFILDLTDDYEEEEEK